MNVTKICKGVKLGYHRTNKFKTTTMSLNIVAPLDSKTSEKALIIHLLARTTKAHPAVFEMNRALAKLYGAIISPSVTKSGEALVLSLNLSLVSKLLFSLL